MQIMLDELKAKLLEENLKAMFQQAYEQGVSEERKRRALPHILRKTDLAELFQVSTSTVENIIRMEGFPKIKAVTARYPKKQVLEWIDGNIEYVASYTNYFKTG